MTPAKLGWRMTLRYKSVAVTCGSALLVVIILTLAFFFQVRRVMTDELRRLVMQHAGMGEIDLKKIVFSPSGEK